MDGDIPDWVKHSDVIGFARDDDRWTDLIETIEAKAYQQAVEFALDELFDEIVIELS